LSTPPDHYALARRWLRWAEEDFLLAKHSAADTDLVARGACVWAHQAAEKALKALLVHHNVDPPKLHDLDRLVQRLPADECLELSVIELPELTRWAIEGRYPDDLDEANATDAQRALEIARKVLDVVVERFETVGINPPSGTTQADD
jgi:HEPN domain-containing protein